MMTIYIVPTMLNNELLHPLQDGNTPLHCTAILTNSTCMERLLSPPGVDVNIRNDVSWSIEYHTHQYATVSTAMLIRCYNVFVLETKLEVILDVRSMHAPTLVKASGRGGGGAK